MQGALAGPLTRRWGEEAVINVSMACCALSFVLLLIPRSLIGIMLAVGFHVVSNSLLRPCVSSLISKQAAGGQGAAMGLNNSFMSLGRISGPICAGLLFDINTNLPYISGALVLAAGFAGCKVFLQRTPDPKLTSV
jgi:DHA1 family multidrug resistance protein-like MFS transporter